MSLVVNLNVPAGDGVGTAADTSGQGIEKTITVGGSFTGSLVIEASMGGDFVPVATLTSATSKVIRVVATQMRVRRAATADAGAPVVDVTAEAAGVAFQQLAVPAGNGVGASSDITSMGDEITALVTGNFDGAGAINIEVSADNTNWVSLGRTFAAADVYTVRKPAKWARVRRAGVTYGGVPVVYLGSTANAGTGVGGLVRSVWTDGLLNVYVDNDNGDDNNSGLDANDALQTLAAVYRKFPTEAEAPGEIVVNLAAGAGGTVATYQVATLYIHGNGGVPNMYRYYGPPMIAFAPATGPSSATLDAGTPATQIDASDSPSGTGLRCQLNFTTAAPGWTSEDFAGVAFARITRGNDRVIAEIPISGNTADAIYVDHEGVVGVVQAGDLVEVVRPGAAIAGTPTSIVFTMQGESGYFPFASLGALPTFARLDFSSAAFYRQVATFDRCLIEGFWEAGAPQFINCANNVGVRINGCSGTQDGLSIYVLPDETAPLDDSIKVAFTCAGDFAGLQFGRPGGGADSYGDGTYVFSNRASARRLTAANGALGFLLIQAGQRIMFQDKLILSGIGGGSGALINIGQNGFLNIPPIADTDFHQGGSLQGVRLLATGNSVNLDAAVGGFYEVAGYNGAYSEPPASPGDQGDFSLVKDFIR